MLKNKTIILVCKEAFFYPMYFLGRELEKNNRVKYFFIQPTETLNKNINNRHTYFYLKKKINNKDIYTLNDISIEFLNNRNNIIIDYDYLKKIEKNYTNFTNLNKQLLSSQSTSSIFHQRYFFPPSSYKENLYWLILNYKKIENLIADVKPDYIFDLDTAELQRTILNEIAYYKKIPYISQEHSRYRDYILPIFNLGRSYEKYFIDAYKKNIKDNDINEYIKEVKNFRNQEKIMPLIYQNEITSKYNFTFFEAIKSMIILIISYLKSKFNLFKHNKIKIPLNTPLFANPNKKFFYFISSIVKKFYWYSEFNNYTQKVNENEKYVYFPLHRIPESSTYIKAPMYINELNLIEAISKSLPINIILYVKEHQTMIGEREHKFYKQIKKLNNVKLVKSNLYTDPKKWIEKSEGVATITGTSAFEASMLNKPAIVFGDIFYNSISGIKKVDSFNDLERFFKEMLNGNWTKNNTKDCATYIKTVKEIGSPINIKSLLKLSNKKIKSHLNENEETELKNLISELILFYKNSIKLTT